MTLAVLVETAAPELDDEVGIIELLPVVVTDPVAVALTLPLPVARTLPTTSHNPATD